MHLAVLCDFDGTITRVDSVDLLLQKLADPAWQQVEELWERGEIGSRQCMAQQVRLIRGGWTEVSRMLDLHVEVDPTFAGFVSWCRSRGISVLVVSDGLDRSIVHILGREGIAVDGVIANRLVEMSNGELRLDFPHAAPDGSCAAGVCKCEIVRRAGAGASTVYIGDGRSDFCCAGQADCLLAKAKLLSHCRQTGIACLPFHDFEDVRKAVEENFFKIALAERGRFAASCQAAKPPAPAQITVRSQELWGGRLLPSKWPAGRSKMKMRYPAQ